MRRRGAAMLILSVSILASSLSTKMEAQGNDRDHAESVAAGFLKAFDQGDLRPAYREQVGKSFKQAVSEEAFVAQFSIARSQLGGPGSGRQVIDEKSLTQLPNTPQKGTFYFFRYKSRHPVGNVYEDIYLEKEGQDWKVLGLWFFPAPE
jgi:hypothetical protein